jgi:hypothetical protein
MVDHDFEAIEECLKSRDMQRYATLSRNSDYKSIEEHGDEPI